MGTRIFKYKSFHQWGKAEGLEDRTLCDAVKEIDEGLFEANLGKGLYKKRIARKGKGKSGGYRTLIAFKTDDKAVFMYAFSKNERENITEKEKSVYKKLAGYYVSLTESQLLELLKMKELIEVIK